jgi:nitrogen fixation protein NifB
VAFRGQRYTGRDAAKVLSERQLEGLAMLAERKILAKVNSVMIPGINDEHLVEVSRTVKRLGAFLHNVMPLVSAPEHGTAFGLAGRPGPTPQELKRLQDRCAGDSGADLTMMRHCRQCRADAVGLLGEDRSGEFGRDSYLGTQVGYDLEGRRKVHADIEAWRENLRGGRQALAIADEAVARPEQVVLIAVATTGGGVVNQHFGQAEEFWVYEAAPGWVKLVQTRSVARYWGGPAECGEQELTLTSTVRLLSDCVAVLCSKVGRKPREALAAAGIASVEVCGVIEPAVAAAAARLSGVSSTFPALTPSRRPAVDGGGAGGWGRRGRAETGRTDEQARRVGPKGRPDG